MHSISKVDQIYAAFLSAMLSKLKQNYSELNTSECHLCLTPSMRDPYFAALPVDYCLRVRLK